MKELIAGSTALKYWFPECREPKDLDIISEEPVRATREKEHLWIPEFKELIAANKDDKYLDPELLITLKSSHFGFNIFWEKHEYDILFLKSKGYRMNQDLYKHLFKGWRRFHGERWAKLGQKSPDQFFDDAVTRIYNHDSIHKTVAIYDVPLYTKILKNPDSVSCDKTKFFNLSEEDQILLVKEEVWVTNLERYLIPNDFKYSSARGYHQSLKKLVTTMSEGGWFKMFMIDNYEKLVNCKDRRYIEKFKTEQEKLENNQESKLIKL